VIGAGGEEAESPAAWVGATAVGGADAAADGAPAACPGGGFLLERLYSGAFFICVLGGVSKDHITAGTQALARWRCAPRHHPGMWIDTHCHLDAPEFAPDRAAVVARARAVGVTMLVLPAVEAANFDAVRRLAQEHGCAYALGIHPLCVGRADPGDLALLRAALHAHRDDPRLVAVGEIGIDHFVPGLDPAVQERWYLAQLKLAAEFGLPVLLHVRRSADALLKGLRRIEVPGGIAHAFNGSEVQARAFTDLGFRLGFGGTLTFERALQIRRLAAAVPASAPVLETDAPDIPPHWRYRTAAQREADTAAGLDSAALARNEPAELPRIAESLAALRGWTLAETAAQTSANALAALPRLARLMSDPALATPTALA
jgi:TatD DNase family protein